MQVDEHGERHESRGTLVRQRVRGEVREVTVVQQELGVATTHRGTGEWKTGSRGFLAEGAISLAVVIFCFLVFVRDRGYGGPHHDEVIALLAAKGLEGNYKRMRDDESPPFSQIVSAKDWQQFTQEFDVKAFAEIRDDIMFNDKHPPLAFWVMNRWLSLFPEGRYEHAVMLVWLQILVAGGLLGLLAWRCTGDGRWGVLAFAIFLMGNSAIFTATWVRQYALFGVFYALVMLLAGELGRRRLRIAYFVLGAAGLGIVCVLGMMTQYTFATMSAPIHLALMAVLLFRRLWDRLAITTATYALAGGAFFTLLPLALEHAREVSEDTTKHWQWGDAIGGIPQMIIPWPSVLPAWLAWTSGTALLIAAGLLGFTACRLSRDDGLNGRPLLPVILAGMLGAGVLQIIMVGLGYFPGWATGPNHMLAFWLLTVLALTVWLSRQRQQIAVGLPVLLATAMIGMQLLYAWHCHRILPRVNTSYIASTQPDLVVADNLARGFVLQLTDVMPADQLVLVTSSAELQKRLASGDLSEYRRILYLPMDETARRDREQTHQAAILGEYSITELPVVHSGLYEATLFEQRDAGSSRDSLSSR